MKQHYRGEDHGSAGFRRGNSGEITDKGHAGSVEVTAIHGSGEEAQVVMKPHVYIAVDSRMKKRTMIKNMYSAATKTAREGSRSPQRLGLLEDSHDEGKPT